MAITITGIWPAAYVSRFDLITRIVLKLGHALKINPQNFKKEQLSSLVQKLYNPHTRWHCHAENYETRPF